MGNAKAPHHQGTYHRRSAEIRAAAYANPDTICWRCKRTLAEIRRIRPKVRWQAGHLIAGQVDGPLLPECSWCNAKHGQALAMQRRRAQQRTRLLWPC